MQTLEEVKNELLEITQSLPDNINPQIEGGCYYTDPQYSTHHCLIGQYAVNHGWFIGGDSIGADEAAELWRWPIDQETAAFLTTVQVYADSDRQIPSRPRRWGNVAEWLKKFDIADWREKEGWE